MTAPFTLIAGPCVIESVELVLQVAEAMKAITDRLGIRYIFKASFDKANRSSEKAFAVQDFDEGLEVLLRSNSNWVCLCSPISMRATRQHWWVKWWMSCRLPAFSAAKPIFCWPQLLW